MLTPAVAARGCRGDATFHFPPEKPATAGSPSKFPQSPVRSKPSPPSRVRRTRRRCRTKPTRGFAAAPAGRCADQKYVFPCTARPEPLNEQFFSQYRCGEWSSPRPHDQPVPPAGGSPARMLLPPATSRNAGQSHSRKISAMRSRAKPLPIAPRSKSSLPVSQRMENWSFSKVHCGVAGCDFSTRRR